MTQPLKPVFLFGNGLRNNPALVKSLCELGVPVLTTWQGIDLVPEDSPVFCGRPGVIGQRAANIIIQKCNWLMIAGARLDMETVGHDLANFAPDAQKTIVDVDYAELNKFQPTSPFPPTWSRFMMDLDNPDRLPFISGVPEWLDRCKITYNHFRYELDGEDGGKFVEPYSFIRELSAATVEGDVFVPGSSGVQSCAFMQAFAAIASGKRVIVVTGDGGFAQSMGELEVVRRLNLPIHYFVFCNGGYGSISTMQDARFGLRVGSTPESGLTLPNLEKVAALYDMPYFKMTTNSDLPAIGKIIEENRPTITRVNSSLGFRYATKVESSIKDGVFTPDDLGDMTPHIEWKDLL
jgi:acetolactate synthase-1/2/3 large subunit